MACVIKNITQNYIYKYIDPVLQNIRICWKSSIFLVRKLKFQIFDSNCAEKGSNHNDLTADLTLSEMTSSTRGVGYSKKNDCSIKKTVQQS